MRALVVGAGSIGQYMAARLQQGGHEPVFWMRGDVERLTVEYTLHVGTAEYRAGVQAVTALSDDRLREPFELAIVAVKTFSTQGAIEAIAAIPACSASTVLVMENGLGSEELCAAAFGADRVVAGALTTAVEKTREGVRATSKGGLSIAPLGSLPNNWLVAALGATPMRLAVASDWRALKWSKLCINLLANAVCAVLDWPPERVYADTAAFSVERRCLLEAIATMDKLAISPVALIDFPVPWFVAGARSIPAGVFRLLIASRVTKGRGGKLPSLLLDMREHRTQLEVDALNGAVASRAAAAGVAAPANATVTRILDGITAGTLSWDDFRGKPAALAAAIRATSGEAAARAH